MSHLKDYRVKLWLPIIFVEHIIYEFKMVILSEDIIINIKDVMKVDCCKNKLIVILTDGKDFLIQYCSSDIASFSNDYFKLLTKEKNFIEEETTIDLSEPNINFIYKMIQDVYQMKPDLMLLRNMLGVYKDV